MVELKQVTKPAVEELIAPHSYFIVLPRYSESIMKDMGDGKFGETSKAVPLQLAVIDVDLGSGKEPIFPQITTQGDAWKEEWRTPLQQLLLDKLGIGTSTEHLFHVKTFLTTNMVSNIILTQCYQVETQKANVAKIRWLTPDEIRKQSKSDAGKLWIDNVLNHMALLNFSTQKVH